MTRMKLPGRALPAILLLCLAMPLAAERVLRAGSMREPAVIDPARAWDDTSSFYIVNIFETLVKLEPRTMKIAPALAVRWETSPDGRTWTFDLRRGVRFHDGTPFDADAVVFTFFRQLDPANPDRRSDFPMFAEIFPYLKAVRKVSPYKVQFILSEPFFPFLASLTVDCAAIVPPAAVKKAGAAFARQPVGTGPFKLRSWQRDKRLVLAANADYWRGRPAIDTYIDTIEPQADLLAKYFKDGKLDIIRAFSISKIPSYRTQDWVQVVAVPSLSVTYIVINAARPQLSRRPVRQALGHAWDPRTLKLIFQEFVLPVHSLLPAGLTGGSDEAQPVGFSLAKAQALLKKEGGGRELQLEMLMNKDDGLLLQLFSMYARNLKQAGIRLKLTTLEQDAYSRRIARGDFDLSYSGWVADYPDPDSMLFPLLSEQLQKQGFANIAGSKRKDIQDRLVQARRESNAQKRLAIYREIDRTLVLEGLVIPLYQDLDVLIAHRKLGRIQPSPLGRLYLYDLQMQ